MQNGVKKQLSSLYSKWERHSRLSIWTWSWFNPAPYIIIQRLIIQLLQLCLVIPELDSIQYLCQQQNQGVFVPVTMEKTEQEFDQTVLQKLLRPRPF